MLAVLSCAKDDDDDPVIDKVRIALSTNVANYDAATVNKWVNITEAEYNNLLITVNGAARYGAPEIFMNIPTTNGWTAGYTIGGSNNVSKVPASSYIIAWSIRTGKGVSSSLNSKLKISTTQKAGYTDYGSPLPDIGSIPANRRVYFVLKTPDTVTPSTPCYTAVYNSSTYFLGDVSGAGPEYYAYGDSTTVSSSFPSDSFSQVVSVKTKQW